MQLATQVRVHRTLIIPQLVAFLTCYLSFTKYIIATANRNPNIPGVYESMHSSIAAGHNFRDGQKPAS